MQKIMAHKKTLRGKRGQFKSAKENLTKKLGRGKSGQSEYAELKSDQWKHAEESQAC